MYKYSYIYICMYVCAFVYFAQGRSNFARVGVGSCWKPNEQCIFSSCRKTWTHCGKFQNVYFYSCTYAFMHTQTYVYMYMYIYIYIYIYMYTHTHIQKYMHMHAYKYTDTCMHAIAHANVHTTLIHTYMLYTYTHV